MKYINMNILLKYNQYAKRVHPTKALISYADNKKIKFTLTEDKQIKQYFTGGSKNTLDNTIIFISCCIDDENKKKLIDYLNKKYKTQISENKLSILHNIKQEIISNIAVIFDTNYYLECNKIKIINPKTDKIFYITNNNDIDFAKPIFLSNFIYDKNKLSNYFDDNNKQNDDYIENYLHDKITQLKNELDNQGYININIKELCKVIDNALNKLPPTIMGGDFTDDQLLNHVYQFQI
jgi:hypothetical protein